MSFTGTLPSLKMGLRHNNHSDLPEKFKYNDCRKLSVHEILELLEDTRKAPSEILRNVHAKFVTL